MADDLLAALKHEDGAPRSILLWLDPDGAFTRLGPALEQALVASGASLLSLDAGAPQLTLKLQLLEIEADRRRAVVHLPGWDAHGLEPGPGGAGPALWGLVEYRYKGNVWGHRAGRTELDPLTLDRWLETHGVHFSGGGARAAVIAGGPDSRLARFVAKKSYLDPAEFPRSINTTSIATEGDPRDRAVELLMDAAQAVVTWGETAGSTRELIGDAFGRELAGPDPTVWAQELAVHLALLDAWDATGRLVDFPFASRVPSADGVRTAGLDFVRQTIAPRSDVVARVRTLVGLRSLELGGLTDWAASRLWMATPDQQRYRSSGRQDHRLSRRRAGGRSRCRVGRPPGIAADRCRGHPPRRPPRLMSFVVDLAGDMTARGAALASAKDAAAMASIYATSGWRADAAWLAIAAGAREIAELAPIRRLAARLYAAYVDRANQRFTDLIEAAGAWPPPGLTPITDDAAGIWERPAKSRERRAVIIVDAMRMDVGRAIEARLGSSALLKVRATTLPTTTPFGMSALLPATGSVTAEIASGGASLSIDGHTGLDNRDGRKAYLSHVMGERGDSIEYIELEDVLQGAPVPRAGLLSCSRTRWTIRGTPRQTLRACPKRLAACPGASRGSWSACWQQASSGSTSSRITASCGLTQSMWTRCCTPHRRPPR